MTWQEWCNSEYNTSGFEARDTHIKLHGASILIRYDKVYVLPTDLIYEDRVYETYSPGGGGGAI